MPIPGVRDLFEHKLLSVALHSADSRVLPRTYPVSACHPSCPENPTAVCSTCLMALAAQPALCTLPTPLFCPGRQSKLGLDSLLLRGPRRAHHASSSSPEWGQISGGSKHQVTSLVLPMPDATPARLGSVPGTVGSWHEGHMAAVQRNLLLQ